MSREFVTNVGGTGNRFRISFSEEKPEPKVSKLTLSSDFTHSYEEGYEDENDVLVVDIDYGDGNANEDRHGNDTDSPESISRSSSLSSSSKRERPKVGLKRFKSVEAVIDVAPVNRKKKLKKTVSDYETRYKGLEKKEARLTLSADFTHSYEENFDDDGEVLVVDIDYSKDEKGGNEESFEDRVFSASDNFGRAETENNNRFRKYYSHEDVRYPSHKHRDLERSSSGYEITFINESAPDERKKLSLSADLSTSSEEILRSTDVLETQQSMKNNQKLNEEEVFMPDKYYVTSTPQKHATNTRFYTDNQSDDITKDAYKQEELVFEEKPEKTTVGKKSPISDPFDDYGLAPGSAEKPLETFDLDSNNFRNTDYHENYVNGERKEDEKMLLYQRKEDERLMKNIKQKESDSAADNIAQWHLIETEGLGGSEGTVEVLIDDQKAQIDDGGPMASKGPLEMENNEADTSRGSIDMNKVSDSEEVIAALELRDVENAGDVNLQQAMLKNDVEGELDGSSTLQGDGMKIDLDDILIIDIASNDRESESVMIDESNQLGEDTENIDDAEIKKGSTSNRAEVYIYALNQTGENEDTTVCDKNPLNSDNDVSQIKSTISTNVIDDHVKLDENDLVDEELDNLSKKKDSVDEEASVLLQQTNPPDNAGLYADYPGVDIAKNAYKQEELVFEEKPEKTTVGKKSPISDPFDDYGLAPGSAEKPLETFDLDSNNFRHTDHHENYVNGERKEDEEMLLYQRKEDERSMKNIEKKESDSAVDNIAHWHLIETEGLGGSEGTVEVLIDDQKAQIDDGGPKELKGPLEVESNKAETSRGSIEMNKVSDREEVIAALELRDVENAGETNLQQAMLKNDVEGEMDGSSTLQGDGMKIDLDDILIIDIASNDRESESVMIDESNQLGEDTDNIDDVEIKKGNTSNRAEVYIYALNQTGENEDTAVCDKNPPNSDNDVSQIKSTISTNVIDDHVKLDENDLVDEELDNLSKKKDSVDEEASVHLQQTDPPNFGGKMRLLELVRTSGGDESSSLDDREDQNVTDDGHLINGKGIALDEGNERENGIFNQLQEAEDQHGNSNLNGEKSGNSCNQQTQMNENVSREFETEPDKKNLENSVDTGSCEEVGGIFESRKEEDMDVRVEDNEEEGMGVRVDDNEDIDEDDVKVDKQEEGMDVHVDDNEDIDEDDVKVDKQEERKDEGNVKQMGNAKSNKFFKMIIIREVPSDYSNMESYEEDDSSSVMTGRISRSSYLTNEDSERINYDSEETAMSKSEYLFPMPIGAESECKSEDIGREEELTNHEDAQFVSPKENDTQTDISNDNGGILKRLEWPGFWGFWRKLIPGRFARWAKKESSTDLGHGPIPNGACKTSDDYGDEWPKLVNKVYRLKNIHSDKKLLTETIRIFLQQEDVFS